jgi:hypothetical protein
MCGNWAPRADRLVIFIALHLTVPAAEHADGLSNSWFWKPQCETFFRFNFTFFCFVSLSRISLQTGSLREENTRRAAHNAPGEEEPQGAVSEGVHLHSEERSHRLELIRPAVRVCRAHSLRNLRALDPCLRLSLLVLPRRNGVPVCADTPRCIVASAMSVARAALLTD